MANAPLGPEIDALLLQGFGIDTFALEGVVADCDITVLWHPTGVKATFVLDGLDPVVANEITGVLAARGYGEAMPRLFAKRLVDDATGLEEAYFLEQLAAALAAGAGDAPKREASAAGISRRGLAETLWGDPWTAQTVGGSAVVEASGAIFGFSREASLPGNDVNVSEFWCREGKTPLSDLLQRALLEAGAVEERLGGAAVAQGRHWSFRRQSDLLRAVGAFRR